MVVIACLLFSDTRMMSHIWTSRPRVVCAQPARLELAILALAVGSEIPAEQSGWNIEILLKTTSRTGASTSGTALAWSHADV
jgi:hypothetical protein